MSGKKQQQQTLAAVTTQGISCKLHCRENPALNYLPSFWTACLYCVSASWTSPYNRIPGILFQPIGLRLSPSNWSRHSYISPISFLTNQSEWLHSDQSGQCHLAVTNQTAMILECLFTWRWANQEGPGAGTFVCISQLPSGFEFMFPFQGRLTTAFPLWSWNTKGVSQEQSRWHQCRAEQSGPDQGRPVQGRADQQGAEQNCLARKGPGPRASSKLCCFHSCAVAELTVCTK